MIDNLGVEVIALAVDVGQAAEDYDIVKERARAAGAVDAIVVDAKEEYAAEYCMPALAANALYENRYPLVSALSRPVIVKHLVERSEEHTSELQSLMRISYAVFCVKNINNKHIRAHNTQLLR